MMMTTIWFVRHGKIKNPHRVIAGRSSGFGLSREGEYMVKKAANFFKNRPISAVYSSPQQRCLDTAKIIVQSLLKKRIIKEKSLNEADLGWEGIKEKEFEQSDLNKIYQQEPSKIRGNESFIDVAKRARGFILQILRKHKGKQLICVSHQDVIRSLRLLLKSKSIDLLNKLNCDRASITGFIFKNNDFIGVKYFEPNKNG